MKSKRFFLTAGSIPATLLVLVLFTNSRDAQATTFTWASGVSGTISDATKWTPSGVPGLSDRMTFSPAGSYVVTFPSAVPQTNMVTMTNGVVTFVASSPHTTGGLAVYPNSLNNALTMNNGTFNINYLDLGTSGFNSMTVSSDSRAAKTALLHSNGVSNPHGDGDVIGYGGISEMYVTAGGRYICESTGANNGLMRMADQAGSAATLSISGSSSFFPQTVSSLQLTGGASMTVGVNGTANLFASNRGFIDETGDMFVATNSGSSGYVTIGPASSGTSYLEAHQRLLVGSNGTSSIPAGHGELTIRSNGLVRVTGACEVADGDNGLSGNTSVIRVQQGGNLTILGGIRFFSAGNFDLQGGLVHVKSGVFSDTHILTISSQTGTPILTIDNNQQNVCPTLLYVGRSGNGTLRLSGSGTWMSNIGTVVVGDSTGGMGTIDQDSLALMTTVSPFNIGVAGSGTWNVHGGAHSSVGTLAVGVASGGVGVVNVYGKDGTRYPFLEVSDNLWIGGGFGGPGGTGTVTVETDGILDVAPLINQTSHVTLYGPPGSGTLVINDHGTFNSSGDVSDGGTILLHNATLNAPNVTLTGTGGLTGFGTIKGISGAATMLQNGGRIDTFTPASVMGMFTVMGDFLQVPSGHYLVNLNTSGGQASDYMIVSGNAALGGTLDLVTGPGFTPGPGETFPILFCGSHTGTFDAVTWNGHPLAGEATIDYGATLVNVVMPGVSAVGDPTPFSAPAALRFAAVGTPQHPAFTLQLPRASEVSIRIYDVSGREVSTLFEGALEPGRRRLGLENAGNLASGTYFARAAIRSDDGVTVKTARTVLVH